MVHHQHQHVLIRPQGQELGPQRRLARQVEGPAGDGGQRRGQPGLVDVDDLVPQRAGVWLQDLLAGLAVGLGEHRPQALVASDHVGDGGLERRLVEAARQPQRQGDVIGRTAVGALQLIQEPQPALGEGQGQLDRPLPGSQCQPGPVRPGQVLGQLGHGRGLEHRPDRQLRIQQRPGAGDHLHGQQGVAPEVEEVVVDAHRGQAQQLGEHLAQDLLVWGPGPSTPVDGGDLGRGQGLAVELAVGGQGQRLQNHEEGGHHVVGQDLGHVLPHDGGQDLPSWRRHHVGHQPLLGRPVLPHHHHRLADVGVAGEDGLHLTQLDAKAPQLDLVVDPADEDQLALGVPAHQVAGAVHAAAGGAEGAGHEALGAQSGPVQVAPGQTRPGDVELAHHPRRRQLQAGVEHVELGVGDRAADGDHVADLVGAEDRVAGGEGCRLRRSVAVDHHQARARRQHLAHGHGRHHVAADPQLVQPVEALGAFLRDQVEQACGQPQPSDGVLGDQPAEGGEIERARWSDDDLAAGEQRDPELVGGGVERQRRVDHHPLVATREARVECQLDHVLVLDQHPLGHARRARGVDHIGRVPGMQRCDAVGVVGIGVGVAPQGIDGVVVVQDDHRHPAGVGQGGGGGGDQARGLGVVEHELDPRRRVVGVDGHIGGTGLEHGQHGDDHLQRAGHGQGHELLGPDTPLDEQPGQAVGPGVELGVGEGGVLEDHRGVVGGALHLGLEQRRQGALRHVLGGVVVVHQQPAALVGAEDVDAADGLVGVGNRHGFHESHKAFLMGIEGVGTANPPRRPPADPDL